MERLIEFLKNRRKQAYIQMNHSKAYAFIGIGNHSINNLYPVINHFRLNLKYIVTKSESNAAAIDKHYPNIEGTNNLDKVLNDDEIGGVFICTNPKAHFSLVKKVLQADKNVYVEKPPCLTLEELHELIEIEKSSKGKCLVGFQKQYAPSYISLKKEIKSNSTYSYKYLTGAYPEGDAFFDLYIHGLSLLHFLFGKAEMHNAIIQANKSSNTVMLQIKHPNNIVGQVELSTAYSWKNPEESISYNSAKGVYKSINSESLTLKPKDGNILGIPKEKVLPGRNQEITLQERNNFLPVMECNQLYTSGFYNEIKEFIELCEKGTCTLNSSLESCIPTYQLISEIKKQHNV